SRRHQSAPPGPTEGLLRAAARSPRLGQGGAFARDRCRSCEALSRHDRVRVRDGGRTVARPDRNSPAAHALRACPATGLAKHCRSVGGCTPGVVVSALSLRTAQNRMPSSSTPRVWVVLVPLGPNTRLGVVLLVPTWDISARAKKILYW